jgi:hypothetical protein
MKFKFLAAAATALLFPMAVWAVPVAVSMTPAQQAVAQGANITVTIRIGGLLAAMDQLSAYDIRVNYDSSKLTFVSQAFLADAPFGLGALENFDGTTAGLAIDQVDSFLTSPADLTAAQAGLDGFDLFSLTFKAANMDAVTNLSFAMVPNFTKVLGNNNGNDLSATYTGACVGIGAGVCGEVMHPVPEPETYSLMALGLLVAGAYGRRAKRRARAALATA